ncbi:MFS transporter [Burkholderia sp. L27(2015)]|uniref:MFS transporter n=1 Tax=Burkholderia sp. L27(2015) TaxID=1641858 RepID=UPI00131C0125|nr:MFS transporter [Burkholderia sp. L27(2015)]
MKFFSAAGFRSDQEYTLYNKAATRLLPFLLLLYIVAFLDRINVSFAKLSMAADAGIGDAAYGLGAGIFFIAYCLFEIPSNLILRRVGARFWIARIMFIWGLVCAAMAWVHSPLTFYVTRFILGIAEAGFYPGVVFYLTYWFPRRLRGQATAIFVIGIPLAGVIGAPMCGWVMAHMGGVAALQNWQWLFVLTGLPATVLGVITYFFLDDNPDKARWLTADDRALMAAEREAELRERPEVAHMHSTRAAFANGTLWLLAFVNFSIVVSLYALSFWLPQIVKSLGVSNAFENGLIVAIPSALAAVCMICVARHSDRRGEHRWHMAGAIIAAGVGLCVASFFSHNAWISMAGLSLAMMGILTSFTIVSSLPGLLVSGAAAAAGIALITTVGNLGGYVGPFLLGWIKQATGHLEYALFLCGMLLFAGALITLWLPGLRRARHEANVVRGKVVA